MQSTAHETPLPPAVTGSRNDLSPEGRARVRALMGARPMAFLRELAFAWAVIIGAIAAAESIDSWWATVLAMLIVATRQNVLGLLVHEQAHHLGFVSRWGDLFVNLTAAYPLIVLRVGDYAQVHLMHHKHFFRENDPDFRRKSGEDWTFPMKRWRLLRLFARDLLGLNFGRTFKGKKMQGGKATPFRRKMAIPGWVHGAYLAGVVGVLVATGAWTLALLYWVLPLLTVFQVIVRWGALCEHKYNLRDAALEDATPVITLSWWEKLLLPNLNFHLHLYHHYFANVSFSNLPKLHDIFVEEDLVNEWNIYRGYAAFFRALTAVPEKAASAAASYGGKTSTYSGR
jgi:fatty acid desaturase